MYKVSVTGQFKKDFKLISKRNYDISKLENVINLLINNEKLPERFKEHPLKNSKNNYIDCHILPDWLLLFKRDRVNEIITLVRTGSHADLF